MPTGPEVPIVRPTRPSTVGAATLCGRRRAVLTEQAAPDPDGDVYQRAARRTTMFGFSWRDVPSDQCKWSRLIGRIANEDHDAFVHLHQIPGARRRGAAGRPKPREADVTTGVSRRRDSPAPPLDAPPRAGSLSPEANVPDSPNAPATIAEQLRVVDGFTQAERRTIVERLGSLDTQLASLLAADTDLQLSIKDRGRPGQKVILECWVAGRNRLIASSSKNLLMMALVEVRDDLRRQLAGSNDRVRSHRNRPARS